MFEYFNLNKRYQHYLRSLKDVKAQGNQDSNQNSHSMKLWEQLLIYLFVTVGVVFSEVIIQYINTSKIIFNIPTVIELLIYSALSLLIFPIVYYKIVLNSPKPILVQIGLAFQSGVFYQIIMKAVKSGLLK